MERKTVSGTMLTVLLIGMLTSAFNIQPARASGTIYIRPDGSVDPPTAPIQRDGDIYTFTNNIYDEIVVQKDNIVVDGAGYTVQGTGAYGSIGVNLSHRNNVTIKNVEVRTFDFGIYLYYSLNNNISGNNITTNDWYGIDIWYSSNNTLTGNNIKNNDVGISFIKSPNSRLRGNSITDNLYNFVIYGEELADYVNDVDDSNTVNGKPIYYWINRKNADVPLDAGYVALVNCTQITVSNLNLTNNGPGLLIVGTSKSTITQNVIVNNLNGIELYWSSDNIVSENNVTANGHVGIGVYSSNNITLRDNNVANHWSICIWLIGSNNMLSGNYVTRALEMGMALVGSNNTLSGNNIISNSFGLLISGSSNRIYHNNFINNTGHVDLTEAYNTTLDDGYPFGGNYWSDYTDVDLFYGPNQDIWGRDGIWDHEYVIDANNTDNYPLVKPYVSGNLTVSVYTDKTNYNAGDIMHLGLNVTNPDSVKYLCFAIWVELPDGSIYQPPYMHEHSVILPIGLNYANPAFDSITLPTIPSGTYTWHVAFLERTTHTIITEDTAEWQFS